ARSDLRFVLPRHRARRRAGRGQRPWPRHRPRVRRGSRRQDQRSGRGARRAFPGRAAEAHRGMKRWVVLVMALAGCAALEPNPVDRIVAEAVVASRAPFAEQQASLGRARQAFAGGAPAARLRLAMLLATLPPPLRDDARVVELLEPIADAGAPGVGRFAALLSSQVMERRRATLELDRLRADAERAGRERALADKERDKREEAMKQQLEALRAIERGILEREEKLRRRTR